MALRNSPTRFGPVAQALHWSMFVLIALQLAGGAVLEELPRKTALRSFAFDAHESIGLLVLLLLALRLAWRVSGPVPEEAGPRWQQIAAKAAHAALYVLMAAVPLVGYAMVDAKGHDVAFFGLPTLDLFVTDKVLGESLAELHEVLAWSFALLVAGHVGAALWHHWVARDAVLRRMLPAAK